MFEKNNKIHFITFYTNKSPALDLTEEESFLKKTIGHLFDSYTSYNPNDIDTKYSKSYPNLNVNEHSRGCYHGFWAWKPHIILKKISENHVNEGDVVVYSDCNITRYKERINDFLMIKDTTIKLFTNIDCDFLISKDHNNLKIKQHVKEETIKTIIGEKWSDHLNAPLLHANRVFVRKSKLSIDILKEWEYLCLNESLLLPTLPEKSPLRWHTHDQAIITTLCKKLAINKVLPLNWPGFCYDYNILNPNKKIRFEIKKNNRIFYIYDNNK